MKKYIILLGLALGFSSIAEAKEPPLQGKRKGSMKALAEGCAPATAQTDLNINNVRALILAGGDMWWDLDGAPRYEVPKGSQRHSMFAGALWLGGIDEADQLKLAAMTYRQSGVDYWTGPLSDDNTASITQETCNEYDRQWLILREDVETHAAWIACKEDPSCDAAERFPGYASTIPLSITSWPGNGINGELINKLAPYIESTQNGTPGFYDPEWDYPAYDINRSFDCTLKETDLLYGDQTIWWVYNDKGNVHTETQAGALGFEVRAQAFSFTSNDEINNMTFNNYRILNKSTFRLADTYFGTWFDPDLGFSEDDIIGSDIARGLGYCYNADADDQGPRGYGLNPPAVGFDFFQGPFADYFDGLDNDRDGCVDGVRDSLGNCISENAITGINERIIMSGFMYFNNRGVGSPNTNTTDPNNAQEFYNYLQSKWKNGNDLVVENPSGKGGLNNGDGFTPDGSGTKTLFAYPGESFDTTGNNAPTSPVANGGWWESPGNGKDKRGLHTAGPFSLAPGALNFITTGVVWARNFSSQDLFASVEDVIVADDKAQQLFDNCFQILDGPKSPNETDQTLEIIELDEEIVINFVNPFNDNIVGYSQRDPLIPPGLNPDGTSWSGLQIDSARRAGYFDYKFEGFQIFQVSGPDVSVENLYDASQSRLVAQSDLKNGVDQLVNYTTDPDLDDSPLVPQDMTLVANNNGIVLSYSFTEDQFATGNKQLVNDREYYFYIVAYAQNNFIDFDPRSMGDDENAQKTPYLAGRDLGNGQKPYTAIPTKVSPRNNGTVLNSNADDPVEITRLAGAGNGGNFLSLTTQSREDIVAQSKVDEVTYELGGGPFDIRVANPFDVIAGNYILTFDGAADGSAKWYVREENSVDTLYNSRNTISFLGEEIIPELGLAISFTNQQRPGNDTLGTRNNGIIGAEITYDDQSRGWLSGVSDDDSFTPTNWILAGTNDPENGIGQFYIDFPGDNKGLFESILSGTWAPLYYGSDVEFSTTDGTPGFGIRPKGVVSNISSLANVDIVITTDHTKWTRVPVLELGDIEGNNVGEAPKFTLRRSATLNKTASGELVPAGPVDLNDPNTYGWSYFPGYAVNVETGRRLCIAFGENSYLRSENGADMIWNPTSNVFRQFDFGMGGMHVIYVFGDSTSISSVNFDLTYTSDLITDWPLYDRVIDLGSVLKQRNVFNAMHWASIPLVNPQFLFNTYDQIATDAQVALRVAKPYQRTDADGPNDGYPQYKFNTNGREAVKDNLEVAKSALDLVNVVPNPYYGGSLYEDSQLDNIIKINNLPPRCDINIYMTNGTLVRNIDKDNTLTFVEWDLKNDYNVPITSGVYLIHIDAGETGETVRKFVCTMRPVDLNAF
jgi:hypothetical protein